MAVQKETVFSIKLEPGLWDAFKAEAKAEHRSASQIIRELMREFIYRKKEIRAYDEFLNRKVDVSRVSAYAGLGRSNEDVEAEFSELRKEMIDCINEVDT